MDNTYVVTTKASQGDVARALSHNEPLVGFGFAVEPVGPWLESHETHGLHRMCDADITRLGRENEELRTRLDRLRDEHNDLLAAHRAATDANVRLERHNSDNAHSIAVLRQRIGEWAQRDIDQLARIRELEHQLDEAQLRTIEASNPGIDMDRVRAQRAARPVDQAVVDGQMGAQIGEGDDPGRPFAELRESGLLWLINRTVFHPRGYALAISVDDAGNAAGWLIYGDGSEPWKYAPEVDEDAAFHASNATMFGNAG